MSPSAITNSCTRSLSSCKRNTSSRNSMYLHNTQKKHRIYTDSTQVVEKKNWCISKLKHPTKIKKITLHSVTRNIVFYCNTLSGWPKRIAEKPSCVLINGLDFKLTQPKLKLMNSYLSNALSAFSLRSLKVPPPTPTHVALFCKLSVHQVLGTF